MSDIGPLWSSCFNSPSQKPFVQFQNNRLLKENKYFFEKLRKAKRSYLEEIGFGDMQAYKD